MFSNCLAYNIHSDNGYMKKTIRMEKKHINMAYKWLSIHN